MEITSPTPLRPFKRKISQLSDLQEQQDHPQLPCEERETTPPARLFDWLLRDTTFSIDRGRSRSDGYLLELKAGEKSIEAAIKNIELASPTGLIDSYSVEAISSPTVSLGVMTNTAEGTNYTATGHPEYRLHVLKENGIYVDEIGVAMDDDMKASVLKLINEPRPADSPPPSEQDLLEARETAQTLANQNEESFGEKLRATSMFPKWPSFCFVQGNYAFGQKKHEKIAPSVPGFGKVSIPKPDTIVGFDYNKFEQKHRLQLNKEPLSTWGRPMSGDMVLPYLIFVLKSELYTLQQAKRLVVVPTLSGVFRNFWKSRIGGNMFHMTVKCQWCLSWRSLQCVLRSMSTSVRMRHTTRPGSRISPS